MTCFALIRSLSYALLNVSSKQYYKRLINAKPLRSLGRRSITKCHCLRQKSSSGILIDINSGAFLCWLTRNQQLQERENLPLCLCSHHGLVKLPHHLKAAAEAVQHLVLSNTSLWSEWWPGVLRTDTKWKQSRIMYNSPYQQGKQFLFIGCCAQPSRARPPSPALFSASA